MVIETTFNVFSIVIFLVLLGGILGLFLAFLLLFFNKDNFDANQYLALFLFSLGLMLLHQFLIISGSIYYVPFLTGIILPLEFVLPPALYLYIQTLSGIYVVKRNVSRHFIPVFIGTLLLVPFYMLNFTTKLSIIQSNFESAELPGLFHFTFPVFVTATGLQFIIYFILYFKLLFSHLENIKLLFSSHKKITLKWLRNFLFLMLISWIILLLFQPANPSLRDSWIYIFGLAVIFYLGIMGLLQPRVYLQKELEVATIVINLSKNKFENTILGFEESNRIIEKLAATMKSEKPYLQNNLNLFQLAELISVSPQALTQVINCNLNMNFSAYVNSFRKAEK